MDFYTVGVIFLAIACFCSLLCFLWGCRDQMKQMRDCTSQQKLPMVTMLHGRCELEDMVSLSAGGYRQSMGSESWPTLFAPNLSIGHCVQSIKDYNKTVAKVHSIVHCEDGSIDIGLRMIRSEEIECSSSVI